MIVVQPIPRDWSEVLAWFTALDRADLSNALLGAATAAGAGALLIVAILLMLRVAR